MTVLFPVQDDITIASSKMECAVCLIIVSAGDISQIYAGIPEHGKKYKYPVRETFS
jgi:hypothetical protein